MMFERKFLVFLHRKLFQQLSNTRNYVRRAGKINRGRRDLFLCRHSCDAAVFALGKQCVEIK